MNAVTVLNERPQIELQVAVPVAAASAATLMRVLEEVDYGVVIVDAGGTLRYSNRLGRCELLGSGPIGLLHNRLHTAAPGDRAALSQAIFDAVRGLRRMFTVGHNGASTVVSVLPVADDDGETLALLFFGKRLGADTLTVDFYARQHGLTGAEQAVLKLLWVGHEPKEIAQRQGVAVCTVRSHICNIRLKTQTASIRALLNKLAALPPITSAMKGAAVH